MFEVLIREADARFGLDGKALPVVQMLLAGMTRDTGGLAGFLEKFKAAELGPLVQSWLGGGPAARPIGNSQVEAVLGASDGLLPLITARLAVVPRDNVTSALGYLLPAITGKLTPGGSVASSLPAEALELAAAGQALLNAPAPADASAADLGGLAKWLPWIIVAIAALAGLSYFSKHRTDEPAQPPAASAPAPAATPASAPASQPPSAASVQPAPEAAPASAASQDATAEASAPAPANQPPSAASVEPSPAAAPASAASEDAGAAPAE